MASSPHEHHPALFVFLPCCKMPVYVKCVHPCSCLDGNSAPIGRCCTSDAKPNKSMKTVILHILTPALGGTRPSQPLTSAVFLFSHVLQPSSLQPHQTIIIRMLIIMIINLSFACSPCSHFTTGLIHITTTMSLLVTTTLVATCLINDNSTST